MGKGCVILVSLLVGSFGVYAAENGEGARMLGKGRPDFSLRDIPPGKFKNQLDGLSRSAKVRALKRLKSFEFPADDIDSLNVDSSGDVLYVCEMEDAGEAAPVKPVTRSISKAAPLPVYPIPASIIRHSRPGASGTILLDFNGHTVEDTAWNISTGRSTIPAVSFSLDSDYNTFSDNEQEAIIRVWQRVAEDFAPYDIDVTTEEPAAMNSKVVRVLITRNTDANNASNPYPASGGVSYVGFYANPFYDYYAPCWVYYNNITYNEGNIAEAASHEAGHFIGLSHDGRTDGIEYYDGHGSGETSWAPIMGKSYGHNVTQWSKGEYFRANNTQDDHVILSSKIGYVADDHGDSIAAATPLALVSNTHAYSTTPETDPDNTQPDNKGLISPQESSDVWQLASGTGDMDLLINPWISPGNTRGNNLDIKASLLDSNGTVVAVSDPTNTTAASFQLALSAGTYYIKIEKSSVGSPTQNPPNGYTSYGSCGRYFISGTIESAVEPIPPAPAELTCTLSPAQAVSQGGAWRVLGLADTNWLADGATVFNLGPGDYTVTFKPVTGWTEPGDQLVSLTSGETGLVNIAYTEITTEAYDIPIWWLIENGFTNDPETAVTQIASNNMTVWESYIAGVDPNDPNSALVLDTQEMGTSTEVVLHWQAVQGRSYSIYRMADLCDTPEPIPDAQDMGWPRNSYTNQPGVSPCNILQIRVKLESP